MKTTEDLVEHPGSLLEGDQYLLQKRLLGQFFTISNPFKFNAFRSWWKVAKKAAGEDSVILEPFAGAGNIISLTRHIGIDARWRCFDIAPPKILAGDARVEQRDTIIDFPTGFRIAITNPPYLARNSATRRGLSFPETEFEDLYQVALERMLTNCDWVAAIIPASFITQAVLKDRLSAAIQLNCRMFEDTECPVCLALFTPERHSDFDVYRGDEKCGSFRELKGVLKEPRKRFPWKFNAPRGQIGLRAIDGTQGPSIAFVGGDTIDSGLVSTTSRSVTRIEVPPGLPETDIIRKANSLLNRYRNRTCDVLMTTFKGLRKDGDFRRRLDFTQARQILDLSVAA